MQDRHVSYSRKDNNHFSLILFLGFSIYHWGLNILVNMNRERYFNKCCNVLIQKISNDSFEMDSRKENQKFIWCICFLNCEGQSNFVSSSLIAKHRQPLTVCQLYQITLLKLKEMFYTCFSYEYKFFLKDLQHTLFSGILYDVNAAHIFSYSYLLSFYANT